MINDKVAKRFDGKRGGTSTFKIRKRSFKKLAKHKKGRGGNQKGKKLNKSKKIKQ